MVTRTDQDKVVSGEATPKITEEDIMLDLHILSGPMTISRENMQDDLGKVSDLRAAPSLQGH